MDTQDIKKGIHKKQKNNTSIILIMLALLIILIPFSAAAGAVAIPPSQLIQMLLNQIPFLDLVFDDSWLLSHEQIFFQIRLPRVIMALLVGFSLALAGTTLQGVLQNPLADPYLVGLSSGSALGASIAILLRRQIALFGYGSIPIFAFLGGLFSLFIVYIIAKRGGKVSTANLILAGVAVSAFFSAVVSLIIVFQGERMGEIIFWLMGGLANASWRYVFAIIPYILIGSTIIFLYARPINILGLGDSSAHHLGLEVESVRKLLLACASLITAASVSVTGLIGFVGLIVPHMLRRIIGPDHRLLLLASGIGGAVLLLLADTMARTALSPREIPVGIITALMGAPYFVYLLKRTT